MMEIKVLEPDQETDQLEEEEQEVLEMMQVHL